MSVQGQSIDRKYNIAVHVVNANGQVSLTPTCNGWTAINVSAVGGPLATVNGVPLNSTLVAGANGESFSIGGNENECYQGRLDVSFSAAGGVVLIIEKFYL